MTGLGVTILGLEATSFTVVVFTTIACLALICCNDNSDGDNDEDSDGDSGCCTLFGGFLICLYPIAGRSVSFISSFFFTRYEKKNVFHFFVKIGVFMLQIDY